MQFLLTILMTCLPSLTSPPAGSGAASAPERGIDPAPLAFIYIWGERTRFFSLRDFPEELLDLPGLEEIREEFGTGGKVGFAFESVHLFWLDMWTWNGRYVIYRSENEVFFEPPEEVLFELLGVETLEVPWEYRYPIGLSILITLLALWFGYTKLAPHAANRAKKLMRDPRYQEAHQVFSESIATQIQAQSAATETPPPDGTAPGQTVEVSAEVAFEAALKSLLDYGIPEEEARRKLRLVTENVSIKIE